MRSLQVFFAAPLQVELREREIPEPGPGQVLVHTRCSLISTGTELTLLRGQYPPGGNWASYGKYPCAAGYCNVGVVEGVGEGVSSVKPGDRVSSEGPHASFYLIHEEGLRPIPDSVSDDEAIFATIAEIVMQGVRLADITLGESGVVCGLGLLGQLTVAFARFVGAWPVIGVDLEPFRRDVATRMGATAAVGPQEAEALIHGRTGGLMADVVWEVTGNPDVIPQEILWLRRQGRLILLSSPRGPTTIDFHDLVNARGTIIIGAHNMTHPSVPNAYNRWTRHVDARLFLHLVEAGLLSVAGLLTDRFLAHQAPQAYNRLLHHPESALAVALDWSKV